MNHPPPNKLRRLGRLFKKAAELRPHSQVNMDRASLQEDMTCQTTACHAGWAFILLWPHLPKRAAARFEAQEVGVYEKTRIWVILDQEGDQMSDADYDAGTWSIDQFLFGEATHEPWEGSTLFRDWAHENPELWGNDRGEDMYCDARAFEVETGEFLCGDPDLDHIARFYLAVADRVEAVVGEQ